MSTASEPTYGVDVIARLLNVTPRRVQQLVKDGVIPKASRGKYTLVGSVQGYVKFLQEKLQDPGGETRTNLNEERTRKTKAEADIAEMEAAKMRGDLVDALQMKQAMDLVISEVRAKLLNNAPTRIAARAKSEKREASIKSIAKEEIAASLLALSKTAPSDLVKAS